MHILIYFARRGQGLHLSQTGVCLLAATNLCHVAKAICYIGTM